MQSRYVQECIVVPEITFCSSEVVCNGTGDSKLGACLPSTTPELSSWTLVAALALHASSFVS